MIGSPGGKRGGGQRESINLRFIVSLGNTSLDIQRDRHREFRRS